ncbi:MAG TPA: site-2 protease family protein [Blastocatellia bacterium]|nr:site-2 protease family protein [Blastocatellia bacterium]
MNIDPGFAIIWFVVFLFSLSFHEAAHAWTSEKFGDYTGRYQGRITLNPVAHIDPIGTLLFPIMSMLTSIPFLGWAKPVETNPLLWRDKKKANISVSAAGPISNFILMGIAFIALKSMVIGGVLTIKSGASLPYDVLGPMPGQPAFMEPLTMFLSVFLILNLSLGIFNLIPIPPLDGSHVLESLLPPAMAEAYEQIRPYGFLLLMALLFFGVLGFIIFPASRFLWLMILGD